MLTKQNYEAIAKIINRYSNKVYQSQKNCYGDPTIHTKNFIIVLSNYFEQDNSRFDRQKFLDACGLK